MFWVKVQGFRRVERISFQTIMTDNWTLAAQEQKGEGFYIA